MLNVITTTKTIQNSGGDELIVTTYTVGEYTLARTEFPLLGRVAWKVRAPYDLPSIVDRNLMSKTPKFGVNWSACGTQASVDTRAYAAQLTTAADAADVFTRIAANG